MKMNFVLSETCEGALKASLDTLINENNLVDDYIVIVPETKSLFVERYLLDNIQSHAFSNIYIYTFSRLLKKLQTKPVMPLNKEAGVMVVRNLIAELEDDLLCYKKTASTIGFAENIYETIQQLKSSCISPLELSESAEKCSTALKIKLKDIALLYDSYENYLAEGLIDPSDKLTMLEKEIEISDKVKNSIVYIVGFDSLTQSALNVISSILKNAKSLTVSASFMHPSHKNAHIADNEVYEKLKSLADKNHIKYEPKFVKAHMGEGAKHIYSHLYSYPLESKNVKDFINIFGATTREVEAKKVASLIKKSVLTGESRYKDNCVFLASEDMQSYIESAFDDLKIPYFSSSQFPFENHQLFLFVKLLFLLVRKNLEASDVFMFARLSLVNLDYNKVDDFENYCLKYAVDHGRFLKPFTIEDELKDNAELVRQEIISQISGFFDVYNENLTIFEVCESLIAFFNEFNLENKLKQLEKTQNDDGEPRQAMATEQAYKKLINVLNMLSQFLGSRKMQLDEFYTLIISGLEASDISLLPLGIDNVQIVKSKDGLYNIKNLYIVGATDGNFPHREQDLGLIQDSEITALEGISEKKIEPTIRTINRRERYKIFELLLLPSTLTISFSERASNGEEEKMSALVLALADLFLQDREKLQISRINSPYDYTLDPVDFAYSLGDKQNAIEFLAEAYSKLREDKDIVADRNLLDSLYLACEEEFPLYVKECFENLNNDTKNNYISNADKLFFDKGKTSISELENYFSCPFKHFASYGLRLQERKLASMKALDVGDILHLVCEKFIIHIKNHKNYDIDILAENLLLSALNEFKYSIEENMTLVKILKDETKRLLSALDQGLKSSAFKPVMLEKWFGDDENGINLLENPRVGIVGKIDRVDETSDYFRIIDYKTGKIETSGESIYYGTKLQLAIYLSAIDKIKKQPAGVLYFPVHNEYQDSEETALDAYKMKGYLLNDKDAVLQMDLSLSPSSPKSHYVPVKLKSNKKAVSENIVELCDDKNLLTKEELESMKNYAKAVARKAAGEILMGYYKASPFKSKYLPCAFCEYKNVCGILDEEYKSVRQPIDAKAKEFYKEGDSWQ